MMLKIKLASFALKHWKELAGAVGVILAIILTVPFLVFTGFMPGGEEDKVKEYANVASEFGIDWQELIAFDMVRFDNDLDKGDPEEAALYFIELSVEKLKIENVKCEKKNKKGDCIKGGGTIEKVISKKNYKGKNQILSFIKSSGSSTKNIAESLREIGAKSNYRVSMSSHGIDEAMDLAKFTKVMKRDVKRILDSGMLMEMYPDLQSVSGGIGLCIGDVAPGGSAKGVTDNVKGYKSLIEKYAKKYGVEQYTGWLMAMMQQESSGMGTDPMQASEGPYNTRYPKGPNGIQNAEYSIQAGVQEWKASIQKAGGDMMIAVQTYNFGGAFLPWIKSHGNKYTLEKAQEFSKYWCSAHPSQLGCGDGVHGTPQHAMMVLKYYNNPGKASCDSMGGDFIAGKGDFISPMPKDTYTKGTWHQFKSPAWHAGVDLNVHSWADEGKIGIYSIAAGKVTRAEYSSSYGNVVYIKHKVKGKSFESVYAHLAYTPLVKAGMSVKQGQKIGMVGNTPGVPWSTFPHLHFEVHSPAWTVDKKNAINPELVVKGLF